MAALTGGVGSPVVLIGFVKIAAYGVLFSAGLGSFALMTTLASLMPLFAIEFLIPYAGTAMVDWPPGVEHNVQPGLPRDGPERHSAGYRLAVRRTGTQRAPGRGGSGARHRRSPARARGGGRHRGTARGQRNGEPPQSTRRGAEQSRRGRPAGAGRRLLRSPAVARRQQHLPERRRQRPRPGACGAGGGLAGDAGGCPRSRMGPPSRSLRRRQCGRPHPPRHRGNPDHSHGPAPERWSLLRRRPIRPTRRAELVHAARPRHRGRHRLANRDRPRTGPARGREPASGTRRREHDRGRGDHGPRRPHGLCQPGVRRPLRHGARAHRRAHGARRRHRGPTDGPGPRRPLAARLQLAGGNAVAATGGRSAGRPRRPGTRHGERHPRGVGPRAGHRHDPAGRVGREGVAAATAARRPPRRGRRVGGRRRARSQQCPGQHPGPGRARPRVGRRGGPA